MDLCYYELKATGDPEDLEKFEKIMKERSSVESFHIYDDNRYCIDKNKFLCAFGNVKYSLKDALIYKRPNLVDMCRNLLIDVEIYCSEPHNEIQSHYVIDLDMDGFIREKDIVPYVEHKIEDLTDEEIKQIAAKFNVDEKILKERDEEYGYLFAGGFKHWDFSI